MSHPDTRTETAGAPVPSPRAWEEGGAPPLFGSWRAIHAAVILCAVAVMALVALFSRWPF